MMNMEIRTLSPNTSQVGHLLLKHHQMMLHSNPICAGGGGIGKLRVVSIGEVMGVSYRGSPCVGLPFPGLWHFN